MWKKRREVTVRSKLNLICVTRQNLVIFERDFRPENRFFFQNFPVKNCPGKRVGEAILKNRFFGRKLQKFHFILSALYDAKKPARNMINRTKDTISKGEL